MLYRLILVKSKIVELFKNANPVQIGFKKMLNDRSKKYYLLHYNLFFTVVELLLVIVIISLLSAVIVTASSLVRNQGRLISCKNSLSQICKALHSYSLGWNEQIPATASGMVCLANSFSLPPKVFLCPGDKINHNHALDNGFLNRDNSVSASYMYANHYRDSWEDFSMKSPNPSKIAIEWDLYAGSVDIENGDKRNHGKDGGNVAYLDGHVIWLSQEKWAYDNRPESQ
jgi:prepilin-type processing-associated H-X9-DG protein